MKLIADMFIYACSKESMVVGPEWINRLSNYIGMMTGDRNFY